MNLQMLEVTIMAKGKKIQITIDENNYQILKNIKSGSLKLFVNVAIEQFIQKDESKLFFQNKDFIYTEITKNDKIEVPISNTNKIREWE